MQARIIGGFERNPRHGLISILLGAFPVVPCAPCGKSFFCQSTKASPQRHGESQLLLSLTPIRVLPRESAEMKVIFNKMSSRAA